MTSRHLKHEMSGYQLLFLSFAATFGSGWLFAPLFAAQTAGPSSLVAWLLGGLMAMVIGLTMAEVVALHPKTGGLTHVAHITHGNMLSISITVLNLLVFLILPALETRAVVQYASSYIGGLMSGEEFTVLGYMLSFSLLTAITMVNIYGVKTTAVVTEIVVVFKVLTPILISFTFLYVLMQSGVIENARLFEGASSLSDISWNAVFKAIATSGIIFSFNGFSHAALYAGEAKNPQKAVPFAILGSLIMAMCVYLLAQYVFLMAIPNDSLANGWAKLSFAGDHGPFVGLAVILGAKWILSILYVDAVVSPLGTGFAYASAAPRLIFSMGENIAILRPFLKLNRFGVSTYAIVFTLVVECLVFILLPNLKMMLALLVAAFVLCYTVAPASLLALRKTEPNLKRPFRVFAAPVVCYLSMFFSNLMVYSCGWVSLRNLSVFSLALIALLLFLQRGNSTVKQFKGCIWFLFQLLCLVGMTYLDHKESLAFMTMFSSIAGISAIALALAMWGKSERVEN